MYKKKEIQKVKEVSELKKEEKKIFVTEWLYWDSVNLVNIKNLFLLDFI